MSTAMTTATELTVAAWPGTEPRLLRPAQASRTTPSIARAGGYRPLDDADALLDEVDLPGCSAAAARRSRWRSSCARCATHGVARRRHGRRRQRRRGRTRVGQGPVAAAQPSASGARRAAAGRPHGRRPARARLRLGSHARPRPSRRRWPSSTPTRSTDCRQRGRPSNPATWQARRPPRCARINGGPAKPTDKPPRPFEEGVGGLPTLVSNVETLANLPYIHRHGAQSFRAVRAPRRRREHSSRPITGGWPATRRCTRFRTAWRSPICLRCTGVPADQVRGVLMGGYFAGLLNRDILDATLDHETMRRLGSGLGLRRGPDPHRRLPGRRRGIGDGLLRPRERRPVRIMLQRHGGDGGRHLGAARRRGDRRGRGPAGAMVGGAARPRRMRHPGRAPPTSRRACSTVPPDGRQPSRTAIAPSCRTGAFSALRPYEVEAVAHEWRLEDSSRSHAVRRLRHLRQARTRVLLARRLGLRVAGRRRQPCPRRITTR